MRKLTFICLLFFSLSLCSCSQYILKTNTSSQPGMNGLTYQKENKQVYLCGLLRSRAVHVDTDEQCAGSPASEVIVKKNFGQGLVSIITVGLVNLSTIEYSCAQN